MESFNCVNIDGVTVINCDAVANCAYTKCLSDIDDYNTATAFDFYCVNSLNINTNDE